jgi:heterotetrameric sarcosine oxidase gamma subunit
VTLEFLSPIPDDAGATPPAASPLEAKLRDAGARFEERDGWRVAADFGSQAGEAEACRAGVGIADRSAMGKLELQGRPAAVDAAVERVVAEGEPRAGQVAALDGALLWRSSADRALAVCEPAGTPRVRALLDEARDGCALVELTAGLATLELRGPRARELLERLTAIDVRLSGLPVGGVRAGSVARVPAVLLRPEPEAFLVLVASPEAPDALEIALDAGAPIGVRPVGEEARAAVGPRGEGAGARA